MSQKYGRTVFICYVAYIVQAIVINLAPILFTVFYEEFGLSFEQLGRLTLINFLIQLIMDAISAKVIDKIGTRCACLLSQGTIATGLLALSVFPYFMYTPYAGLVAATVLYAIGCGLAEVLMNVIIDEIPADDSSMHLTLLHSFYSWGQVLTVALATVLVFVLGRESWQIIPVIFAAFPIFCFFGFMKTPLPPLAQARQREPFKNLLGSRAFYVFVLLMVTAGAAEQSISQWSSLFTERALGVNKLVGDLVGPCMFALCMAIGRVAYGIFGDRINLKKTLGVGALMCIVCYFVTALCKSPALSLSGCILSGFAVSLMWPGVLSYASQKFPSGGTLIFGLMAIAGDTGCSVGPWLTGIISDTAEKIGVVSQSGAGLRIGLLASVVFPVIFFILMNVMDKIKIKNKA